jgi:hypothetical protein
MVDAIMKARGVDRAEALKIWETEYRGATTLEGARIAADSRADIAALKQTLGGERGAMTVQQRGDKIRELERSQEALDFRKQLLKQHGSRAESTPEFKRDFDKYVSGLYNRYYGGAGQSSAPASGLTEDQMSLIRKYIAQPS